MLVDETCQGTFSRVFDIQSSDLCGEESESRDQPHEGRFPINVGISGRVATTGRVSCGGGMNGGGGEREEGSRRGDVTVRVDGC